MLAPNTKEDDGSFSFVTLVVVAENHVEEFEDKDGVEGEDNEKLVGIEDEENWYVKESFDEDEDDAVVVVVILIFGCCIVEKDSCLPSKSCNFG